MNSYRTPSDATERWIERETTAQEMDADGRPERRAELGPKTVDGRTAEAVVSRTTIVSPNKKQATQDPPAVATMLEALFPFQPMESNTCGLHVFDYVATYLAPTAFSSARRSLNLSKRTQNNSMIRGSRYDDVLNIYLQAFSRVAPC